MAIFEPDKCKKALIIENGFELYCKKLVEDDISFIFTFWAFAILPVVFYLYANIPITLFM